MGSATARRHRQRTGGRHARTLGSQRRQDRRARTGITVSAHTTGGTNGTGSSSGRRGGIPNSLLLGRRNAVRGLLHHSVLAEVSGIVLGARGAVEGVRVDAALLETLHLETLLLSLGLTHASLSSATLALADEVPQTKGNESAANTNTRCVDGSLGGGVERIELLADRLARFREQGLLDGRVATVFGLARLSFGYEAESGLTR